MSDSNQTDSAENPRSRHRDLTEGPILRTLIGFSIPMLIGNVIQTLNGSINSIWVGRLIGESALAATANANVVMFLLFAAVFGLGNATTVRVGQLFGARDIAAARRTFGSGVGFCVIVATLVAALGWFFSPRLLHLLATPKGSLQEAKAYLRVVFATMPFGTLSMILGMGLRGTGDSKTPLYSMILTVALDIVLNPLLIRGFGPLPALGIAGSAAATGLANFAGVILVLYRLYGHDLPLRLRGPELGYLIPRQDDLAYIVGKGLPMGAQMLLISSSQVVVIGLVNREGLNATAAYSASMQLWNYLQMPAFAIGTAVSAMVAQNIGAGHHDRVNEITRIGMLTNLAMTGLLAGLIVLASHPLLALFLGGDSPALPIAQHIQHTVTWSYIIMGAMMVLSGTMRAYGVVLAPLVIQTLALYPIRLGFYFLLHPSLGGDALWWSFPVSSVASATLTWLLYTRGGWRTRVQTATLSPRGMAAAK
ncbi:MATE family efflux transporter [Novosphingobium sp. G106]|uniref:MATE family efflux transporter n=1 Tax=Novosphingobium sp. G106 TaxID=2849500 RepID=UPI002810DB17|nr:MATE family efflux transporter [Novosphingobium sp. G106]